MEEETSIIDRIRGFVAGWRWSVVAAVVAGLAVLVWMLSSAVGGVASVGLFSALLQVALIPLAVAALFISLRLRDRLAGIDWPKMRNEISSTPLTAAVYCAAWVLAVALLVSSAL